MRRLLLAVALLCVLAVVPDAQAAFPGQDVLMLSAGAGGAAPNGASRHAAISQDKRFGRLAAFESDATNLTAGAGPTTNIYVVPRAAGYGDNGTPWQAGGTVLASVGMGGQPANGPSALPSLDGTSRVAPHCVAFVSAASNLVPGDTNGKPDAFVRDLTTGRTTRVSVASDGRQSNGTVSEVAIDGLCTRVAFVSDGGDLGLAKTRNASWRSAVTRASPPGRRQVYIHAFGGSTGLDRALKGLTFMASATPGGIPGNADSYGISYATNARALAFTSDAANLVGGDGNGASDVYQRVMVRAYGRRVHGHSPQYLKMTNVLVSRGGSRPSRSPASNVDGAMVAYVTSAPELVGADPHGIPQIVQTTGASTKLISRTATGGPGNGASAAPASTAAGSWVVFQSAATDVGLDPNRRADVNGVQDIQLYTPFDRWLIASDSANGPASDPKTSPHGNYVVFERAGQVWLNYVGAR